MAKTIAIHSFRGGTGKTNLTANLAVAIALQGHRVAIVDADLQSPGLHALFKPDEMGAVYTLNDYLWQRSSIRDAVCDVTSDLGITGQGKVFLVPSSVNADEIARIEYEGYNVSLLNRGFQQLTEELALDYLFIDTHPGLCRETLLSIAISDLLFVILRPDCQDFQGTSVTVNVARQLKVKKMMLVVNKAPNQMDLLALQQKVEQTYQLTIAGILPLSEDMVNLGSYGLFCLQYPHHLLTQMLNQIASTAMTVVCTPAVETDNLCVTGAKT
ncbi:ATPase involved in chromosome partitioning [Nostoc sp. PCC 7524]|uniref:MinD/ParA family ATP-binding protein n=1 Tax=Nostoc sp. (strain ATCC 29411 / PCC 7524) TaxID=28072 RepID=UPI00029EF515|nr:MinD/ParA family protein [Nostoc sp. PCC 7524]AFY47592.1 ATPase involved in chromosome partitioning [Nostoc sp. PCC 7524]